MKLHNGDLTVSRCNDALFLPKVWDKQPSCGGMFRDVMASTPNGRYYPGAEDRQQAFCRSRRKPVKSWIVGRMWLRFILPIGRG